MTRLPRLTADELLRKLRRGGFVIVRSSGGQFRLRNDAGRSTTVPRHAGTLRLKTLASILDQVGFCPDDIAKL